MDGFIFKNMKLEVDFKKTKKRIKTIIYLMIRIFVTTAVKKDIGLQLIFIYRANECQD